MKNTFNDKITIIHHYSGFVGSTGKLSANISTDNLHINAGGLGILSTCIKYAIYNYKLGRRERDAGGKGSSGGVGEWQHDPSSYSAKTAGRPRWGAVVTTAVGVGALDDGLI